MEIKQILKEQIELIKPSKEILNEINNSINVFIKSLNEKLKKNRIKAEVFIGGSLAKNTLIKKKTYDADVFIRLENKENFEKLAKILNAKKIHGSRDYYQLKNKFLIIEIVPVLKIKKPEQAENVTDLSYFHVKYALDKIKKNKNLADEIRLAKAFAYAQDCYGAESYIKGFSGYSLELLICHYKTFLKFIREVADLKIDKKQKLIIDDSKFYNKKNILYELNEAKTQSPILLIDPTFKERNALAGLSYETFLKFQKACINFLKNPSKKFFEKKDIDLELIKKYNNQLKIIEITTNRQAGDIAGTKSKKFFGFFAFKLKKEFNVPVAEFGYNEDINKAKFYFVLDKKNDEIVKGPDITNVVNLIRFKKSHKNAFVKNHYAYAKIKHNLSFSEWLKLFIKKDKNAIKSMSIDKIYLR